MGVPLFLTWLRRRFADCFSTADEFKESIDCLYIDLNALLYQSATVVTSERAPSPRPPLREVEDAVLHALVEMLDDIIFTLVKPNALVYLAVDGISPLGKMEQQRMRRRRGGMRAAKLKDMWGWDSNCISVGTPFMSRVTDLLHYYAASRAERVNCERWKKLKESGANIAAGVAHLPPSVPSGNDSNSNEVEPREETKAVEILASDETKQPSDSSSPVATDHDANETSTGKSTITVACNDDEKDAQPARVENQPKEKEKSAAAIHPLCIIVDDVTRPGEGENKILDAIRRFRAQPNYDHNTTYAICSSDTDVIVCSLILHEPRIHVLRYEPPASMTMPKRLPERERGAGNPLPLLPPPVRPDGAPSISGTSVPTSAADTFINPSPPFPNAGKSLLAAPTPNQAQRTQRPAVHRQLSRNNPQQRNQQNRSFLAAKTANAARRSLLAPPPIAAVPQGSGQPAGMARNSPMQQQRPQRPGAMYPKRQAPHAMMATAQRMGRGRGSGAAYPPNRMLGGNMFGRPMRQGQMMMGPPGMFSGGRGFGRGGGGRGFGPMFGGRQQGSFQPRPQEPHVPKFFNMEKFLAHLYKVLGSPDGKEAFARSLHDVVFTLLLFGNDFLPSVGGTIEDGGTLDRLLDILAKEFLAQNRPIVNPHTNQIDFDAATQFLHHLHTIKKGQLNYQASNPAPSAPQKPARKEHRDQHEQAEKPTENADKNSTENAKKNEEDALPTEAEKKSKSVAEAPADASSPAKVEESEIEESVAAKPVSVSKGSPEKRTRSSHSGAMPPNRKNNMEQRACLKAHAYWTMLQWALLYCVGQVPHWRCYYPYSTPPPLLSLTKYSGTLPCSALSPYSAHYLGKAASVEEVKAKIARDAASKSSRSSMKKDDSDKVEGWGFFKQEVSHPVDVLVQLLFLLPGTSRDLLPMVMSRNYEEIDAFVQQPVDEIDIPRISDWCARKSLRMTDNERLRCDGYRFFSKKVAGKSGMDTAFAAYWRQEVLDSTRLQARSSDSTGEDRMEVHKNPLWTDVFERAAKAASFFTRTIPSVNTPATAESPLSAALLLLTKAVMQEENEDELGQEPTPVKEEAASPAGREQQLQQQQEEAAASGASEKRASPPRGSELFGGRMFSIMMAPMVAMQDSRMVRAAGCVESSHFRCGKYCEPLHLDKESKDVFLQWRLALKPDAPEDFFPQHLPDLPDPRILEVVKTGEAADETAVAPKNRKRARGEEEDEVKSASSAEDSDEDEKGSWGSDSMYSYSDYDSNGDGLSHADSETDTTTSKPQKDDGPQQVAGGSVSPSAPNSEATPQLDSTA